MSPKFRIPLVLVKGFQAGLIISLWDGLLVLFVRFLVEGRCSMAVVDRSREYIFCQCLGHLLWPEHPCHMLGNRGEKAAFLKFCIEGCM